ncbi:flagellar motor switch protein FliG [Cereibacter sphaeroides]|nr:flagellar motor switch protein FliG [Cereibacter sphaeroides]
MPQDLAPLAFPSASTPMAFDEPMHAHAPSGRKIPALSGRQKAAIVVRLLLAEGADLKISSLPDDLQTALTETIGEMRLVDRDTLSAVIGEFVETMEQVGLSFPAGLRGALKAMDGRLSPGASTALQRKARAGSDPWERISQTDVPTLLSVLEPESAEVASVVLSKLPVGKAAELLAKMPGDRARRVAYGVSLTEGIAPEMVTRIGQSIAREIDGRPAKYFSSAPAQRVGAILNNSTTPIRESVLTSLEEEDADFAENVRKAIFTFGNVAERVNPRDVPKILRELPQSDLITALAASLHAPDSPDGISANFLLANMSQRMAATLRDEVETRGRIKGKEAEAAFGAVIQAVRNLVEAGEISLVEADEEE